MGQGQETMVVELVVLVGAETAEFLVAQWRLLAQQTLGRAEVVAFHRGHKLLVLLVAQD